MPHVLIEEEAAENTETYPFNDKLRADCLAESSKTFCGLNPCFDITNFLYKACTESKTVANIEQRIKIQ